MSGEELRMMEPETYTYSECQLFQACPRKYLYNYVNLITPVFDGVPRPCGSAIHRGVEVIAEGAKEDPVAAAFACWQEEIPPSVYDRLTEKDQLSVDAGWMQAEVCVQRYPHGEMLRNNLVSNEVVLEGVIEGRTYSGRIDRIIRNAGSPGLWVHDTKTTGFPIEQMVKVARLRKQYVGYVELVEQNRERLGIGDEPVLGVMLDLIQKPRVGKPRKGDGGRSVGDPLFHVEPLHVSTRLRGEFIEWFLSVTRAIEFELNEFNVWPMNADNCFSFMRVCPYYEFCRNPHAIEGMVDGVNFERREHKHRELGDE